MKADKRVAGLARKQQGLITRAQALASGMTARQIDHRVGRGRWVLLRRSVYAYADVAPSYEQAVLAACLSVGNVAFASHLTAARLWGLRLPEPEVLDILVPEGVRVRLDGVRAHRTKTMHLDDLIWWRGIPVTTAARTIVDCSAMVPLSGLGPVVDDADRRRIATIDDIRACHARMATGPGRRATAALGLVLEERGAGYDSGDSDRELWVKRVLERAGLPSPVQQHRVKVGRRTFRLDLAYPEHMVGIEFDGFDTHRTLTAFHADRDRGRLLVAAGWTLVLITARTREVDLARDVGAVLALSGQSTTAGVVK